MSLSVYLAVEALTPAVVFVPSRTVGTVRRLTRFRIPVWIVAFGQNEKVCRDLEFSYGVYPLYEPGGRGSWRGHAADWMEEHGLSGALAVLTEQTETRSAGDTTMIEVFNLARGPLPGGPE